MFIVEFYNTFCTEMNRVQVDAVRLLYFLENHSKHNIAIVSIIYNNKELDVSSIIKNLKFTQCS